MVTTAMGWKSLVFGLVVLGASATAVLADTPVERARVSSGGFLAIVRTVALLPVKGVGCLIGAAVSCPVYWLSGFDPNVKTDTVALRERYCSPSYLFSPEWEQ